MKKFFKYALHFCAFTAGLLVLVLLVSTLVMPKDHLNDKGIQDPMANGILEEPENTIDVLIIGDSETYSSIIPLQMWRDHGITAYCCGTPGQTLCYSMEFLHKAFETQSPKTVILETDTIYKDVPIEDAIAKKFDRFIPLFNYHNRWKTLVSRGNSFAANYTYVENTKGYLYSTAVSAASTEGYMTPSDEIEAIPSRNRNYIEKIKSFCDKRGAKLVLISTPSTKNWNYKRHNAVSELSALKGIDYIDMNLLRDDIPIDWQKETRDKGDHLNHLGAMKVTSYLGNYLSQCGLATNHLGDSKYSSWDKALDDFNIATSGSLARNA